MRAGSIEPSAADGKHCETAQGIGLKSYRRFTAGGAKRSEINTIYSLEQCFVTRTNQNNVRKERT